MEEVTRFAEGLCLGCSAKRWEMVFTDASRQSRRAEAFSKELMQLPDFALVAEIVYINFPNTNMKLQLDGKSPTFELYDDKNLLLTVDAIGWRYTSSQRGGTWSGIIEGNVFSISKLILEEFAMQDYAVFKPEEGNMEDYPIRGKKRLYKKPIDLKLRQCLDCKNRGYIKKVYFGAKKGQLFQADYFIYGGDSRKKFDPFYKCLHCGWTS